MADFLKNHAIENVWCAPRQDRQYVIKPARLTVDGGARGNARVHWDYIPLPEGESFYHIYQIGQIHPKLMNLIDDTDRWISAQGMCEAQGMEITSYLSDGTVIPKGDVYIRRLRDKNIIMAVKLRSLFVGETAATVLDQNLFYVRFYSNAYFDSTRWTSIANNRLPLNIVSATINSDDDLTVFRQRCNAVRTTYGTRGEPVWFIDGYVVSEPTTLPPENVGRVYEMVWDASIITVETYPVEDLPVFNSTLDVGVSKYLILRGLFTQTINYFDDLDFYLIKRETNGKFKGVYLNKNALNNIRQVTHNAYAVRCDLLQEMVNAQDFLNSVLELEVMVVYRNAGFQRGLMTQHNRVEELYKLTYQEVLQAMVGVSSTVDVWTAAALEESAYIQIMRTQLEDITNELVEEAYGYNTVTRVFAEPQQLITLDGANRILKAPPALLVPHPSSGLARRSVYGYDINGKLVKTFNNNAVYETILIPAPGASEVELVEALTGNYSLDDGCVFPGYDSGTNTYSLLTVTQHNLKFYGFRVYACPIVAGVPNEEWLDITGQTQYYTYDESGPVPTLTWNATNLALSQYYPCVKIGGKVLMYTAPLSEEYPGFVRFSVNADVRWLGVQQLRPQTIAPAVVDVFMDGESLIEDIDYVMKWPQIVISRKPKRTPAEGLEVKVRCYGWCDPNTMQPDGPREVGFVKGGKLSVDGEYDTRNDRNIRVVVGGQVKHRSQVRFNEQTGGPLVTDGLPYSISDYVVPVEHFTSKDTLSYRQESLLIDEEVQAYIGARVPQTPVTNPTIIGNRWELYSPFCSAIIHALNNDFLNSGELDSEYTNVDVAGWIAPYAYLLEYDPAVLEYDTDYVAIAPHQYTTTMQLTLAQYRFVEYLVLNYLNSLVDLTPSVTIGT